MIYLQWWDQRCNQTPQRVVSALLKLMQEYAFWYHQSPERIDVCWIETHIILVFLVSLPPTKTTTKEKGLVKMAAMGIGK